MPTGVGDKGIVFAAGSPYTTFSPVGTPGVGDKVTLYNLGNGQRLAVPVLSFSLGEFTWVTPGFQFAGFNWNLDFNFQLLSFSLISSGSYTDHDISCRGGVPGHSDVMYGDDAMGSVNDGGGCLKSDTIGVLFGGDWAYNFSDGARSPTEGTCDDLTFECKKVGNTLEWWIHSGPDPDYSGGLFFSFKGVLLGVFGTSGPGQLAGHGYIIL